MREAPLVALSLTKPFPAHTHHTTQLASTRDQPLCLVAGPHPNQHANAAVLAGLFAIQVLGRTAAAAYAPLARLEPFVPFRDASSGPSTFHLTVRHVLDGVHRARTAGLMDDWGSPHSSFDVGEYDHYEAVEHGDLSWIVRGKLLAFSGPQPAPRILYGYRAHVPEDYVPYFKAKGVTAVVRLNRPLYDGSRFSSAGFAVHELYFPDGTCPPDPLLARFLALAEAEPGALAIHCKAGLGRTGVLICSYLIKHYGFSAEEAIGYIRVVRPGSVIGLQQNYLLAAAPALTAAGVAHRAAVAAGKASAPATVPSRTVHLVASAAGGSVERAPPPPVGPATAPASPAPAPPTPAKPASRIATLVKGVAAGLRGSSSASLPSLMTATPAPKASGVARVLAPNGQPRKVPAALVAAGALDELAGDEEPPTAVGGSRAAWTIGSGAR